MNFFVTGGTLEFDARCYVEREADRELYASLLGGGFCYVLTARQMGKSSLMVRTAQRLRSEGVRVAVLDLTMIGGQNVTPEQWYYGLADTLGQELGLEAKVAEFWCGQRELGPSHRFVKVLRQVVLEAVATTGERPGVRLVVFVDEIDFVRSLKFSTDEFFAAIRECYNHRTRDAVFHGLTFCLLGVASPADLIQDSRTTPFNIGRRIELGDFTAAEAAPLCEGLVTLEDAGGRRRAERILERILHWTSGHPYLTQRLCRAAAEAQRSVIVREGSDPVRTPERFLDALCEELFFSSRARECDDNLVIVRERLLKGEPRVADLLDLYLRVWQGRRVMDDELDPLIATLRLSGIVRVVNGRLRERNAIYLRVFDRRWVRANMPEAELRRQREAFVRGVGWAAALASIIIVALLLLSAVAARQTAGAYLAQARAWRISGLVGQRERALEAIAKARTWGGWWGELGSLREEAIAALQNLDLVSLPPVEMDAAPDWRVVLDPDFAWAAIGRPDGSVRVRDMESSEGLWMLPGSGQRVAWIRFAGDSRHVVVGYGGTGEVAATVGVWRLADPPQEILRRAWAVRANAVDFDGSGVRVALGAGGGEVHLVRLGEEGSVQAELAPMEATKEQGPVVCVRFDPTGRWLAVGTASSLRVELRALDGTETRSLAHSSGPVDFEWHPLGRTLAVAYETGEIAVWDMERRFRDRIDRPVAARMVTDLAYTPDGQVLGALSGDGAMRFWQTAGWRLVLSSVDEGLAGAWQSRRGEPMIASMDRAGRLRRFRLVGGRECLTLEGDPNWSGIGGLAWDRQGVMIAGCGRNEAGVVWWDTRRPESLRRLGVVKGDAVRFDVGRGDWVVAGAEGMFAIPMALGQAGEARLTGVLGPARRLPAPGRLGMFGFSTNGLTAVAVHDAVVGHVRVFDRSQPEHGVDLSMASDRRHSIGPVGVGSGEVRDMLDWEARKANVSAAGGSLDAAIRVEVAPDGAWVLAAVGTRFSGALDVAVWPRVTGQELRFGPARIVARVGGGVALSGDGRWLATVEDGMMEIWRTGAWQSVGRWPLRRGVTGRVAMAFGGALASGGFLVAVAGAESSVALARFFGEPTPRLEDVALVRSSGDRRLESLLFSPDSSRLAAATSDRAIQVWDLEAIRAGLDRLGIGTEVAWASVVEAVHSPITWEVRQSTPFDVSEWEGELWRWTEVESLSARLHADMPPAERVRALFLRARHYFELGRFGAARRDLGEAAAIDPQHPGLVDLRRNVETSLERARGVDGGGAPDAGDRRIEP